MDDNGHHLRQVIYVVCWDAHQRETRVPEPSARKDCWWLYLSCVLYCRLGIAWLTPAVESGLQALDAGLPETSSRPLTRRVVYDRLHYLLEHLLSLVPTLPSTLQPLLVRSFPHKRQSQAAQVTYIRNLLRITDYCPELTDRIMATIIDRAIQIDVSGGSS